MFKKLIVLGLILSISLFIAGCDGFNGTDDGSGELALNIADKPVNNVGEVLVTIDEVQVNRDGENWQTINDFSEEGGEKEFDLMTLRFDEELLGQETLPAGNYENIRLIVASTDEEDGNYTKTGKSRVVYKDENTEDDDIFIPSGQQTGLKIEHNFQVEENSITELTLDVDVSEMLHAAGESGNIILEPTAIDIVDEVVSGNIEGSVLADDDTAITDQDVVIEAYESGADMDTEDPVKKTVALDEDESDGDKESGDFFLRGLEEGTYDLRAYVSDGEGGIDDSTYQPEKVKEVEVTAEETNTIDDITLSTK